MSGGETMDRGLVAEFETPEALVDAVRALRAKGYRALEAYTPYPVREVEDALELPRPRLPLVVFAAGTLAALGAYFGQLWCNGIDYPLNVGARPLHSALAFVPITFEMGILGAALATVLGVAWSARLTRLWRPIFEAPGIESATLDRFWLAVSAGDSAFEPGKTGRELALAGAARVVDFGEAVP